MRELAEPRRSDELLAQLPTAIAAIAEADQREGAEELAAGLRFLNSEGNRSPEPITLIPLEAGASVCAKPDRPLTASETKRCDSSEMRAVIARFQAAGDR